MEALRMLPATCSHDRLLLIGIPCVVLACCVVVLFVRFRYARANFPPGPLPLPIIGHLHLLGKLPHRSLHRLSNSYGPLMGLRFGSVPVIVASTSDLAAIILKTHDDIFASRPLMAVGKYCLFDYSDIVFSSHWRWLRQICATSLFSNRRVESFRFVRQEERANLLSSVFQDCHMGIEVTVRPKLLSVNNNIISRMTMGKTFAELLAGCQEDPSIKFLEEFVYLFGVFNVGDYVPYLQWMDLQGYVRRMKLIGKHCSNIFQKIVDARRRLRNVGPRTEEDLLDGLLSVSENPQQQVQLADDNVMAVLLNMFGAGTHTSAVTTEWALAELLRNPHIMRKAREEIDSTVGTERLVRESDIAHLPYLQAVVKETMRLHPIAPLLLARESTQPCKIAGYDIPAKTRAFVNVGAIGRDPRAWERPLEFWPDRFLKKRVDVQGQHFELLPFGSGRRICPGRKVALLSVELMLASLVQGFEWFSMSKKPELDMSESVGIVVSMAKPLASMASPRLPDHLYCGVRS